MNWLFFQRAKRKIDFLGNCIDKSIKRCFYSQDHQQWKCLYFLLALAVLVSHFFSFWMAATLFITGFVGLTGFLIGLPSSERKAEKFLETYDWAGLRERFSSVLESIKYSRMIELGYELRSNTNIILHEEKEKSEEVLSREIHLKEGERQAQCMVIKSAERIVSLTQQINQALLFPFKKTEIFNGRIQIPLPFHHIFILNQQLAYTIDELSSVVDKFAVFKGSPFTSFWSRMRFTYVMVGNCRSQLKAIEKQLDVMQRRLFKPNQQSCEIKMLWLFQGKEQSLDLQSEQYERLSSLPQYQEKTQLFVESEISMGQLMDKEEQKKQNMVLYGREQGKQTTPCINKKQFMTRLDTLLVMGFARRRQEEKQTALSENVNNELKFI